MNTDIRLSLDFWNHPKTLKLIRRLGLEGARSLQILWSWAAHRRPSGILTGMDAEDIALAAQWDGDEEKLFQTLLDLHWIDQDVEDGLILHGWSERNSWAAKAESRGNAARLSLLARHNPEVATQLRKQGVKGLTGEEYQWYVRITDVEKLQPVEDTIASSGETQAKSSRSTSETRTKYERSTSVKASNKPSDTNEKHSQHEVVTPEKMENINSTDSTNVSTNVSRTETERSTPSPTPSPTHTYKEKERNKEKNANPMHDLSKEDYKRLESFVDQYQQDRAKKSKAAPKVDGMLIQNGIKAIAQLMTMENGFTIDQIIDAMTWAKDHEFWSGKCNSLATIARQKQNGMCKFQSIYTQYEDAKPKCSDNFSGEYGDQAISGFDFLNDCPSE